VESLLHQDLNQDEYEILLVNDGSPDGCGKLAEDYAKEYSQVRVLNRMNGGTSAARNTGIRAASGKYLYFVDPDDYVLENSLRIPIVRMEQESLDVLRFGYTEVDEQYRPTKSCKHPETPDYSSQMMDGNTFMAERLGVACYVWTYIFRTSLLKDNEVFFYEGDYFDDTPWLPRVLSLAKRVDSLDMKRHFYLIRSNSLVQSNTQKALLKKKKGQRFLIKELTRQRQNCQNANADKWYGMMLSHCVLSLLSIVGGAFYYERKQCISELKQERVFPLSVYRASTINKIKIAMINTFPNLFCFIMRARTRV
jgi:glycosyltransferase involved in cell wall biosynthesis